MSDLAKSDMTLEKRMDVLIYLQLDERHSSMTEKVLKLFELGLNSGQIGAIVGKPTNYITATLAQSKKVKQPRASKGRRTNGRS
jgi:hypothetical protein